MDALALAVDRISTVRRLATARVQFLALASVPVVIALFKLAISDGGRDAGATAFAQVVVYATTACLMLAGTLRRTALGTAIAVMAGVAAVSALWSVRPDATIRQVLLWLLYLGLAAVAASTLRSGPTVHWFADALAVVAAWLCLIGLFMFWGAGNPGMRWYSTFYWPNPFAGFLLLVLPLEMVRYVDASPRDVIAHGSMSALLAVAFVLTYSRGAWLSLAAVVPVAVVVLRPLPWPRTVGRVLILSAAVAAVVIILTRGAAPVQGGDVVSRAVSVANADDLSIQGRLAFWQSAWAIFRDYPTGTGAGTFGAVHAAYQRDVRFYAADAHNLYLQTMAELGVPGMVALTAVLATAGGLWVRALRRTRGTELFPVAAGAGLGLLAFFIHSGTEMNWMFPAGPAMAFALMGMLAASDQMRVGAGPQPRQRDYTRVAGAVVLMLAAAAAILAWVAQQEYALGQRLARQGDWSGATRAYRRAERWNPLQPAYPAARAAALLSIFPQDQKEAEAALRRAMALDPMNASPRLALAVMLLTQPGEAARIADIESLLLGAIARDPLNRPQAYRLLARLYNDEGRADEAGRTLREATLRYRGRRLMNGLTGMLLWPEAAGLIQDWAAWLSARGRRDEAAAILTDLVHEDPQWSPAYLDLAALFLREGRRPDALHVIEQGLELTPGNEVLWTRRQMLVERRESAWAR